MATIIIETIITDSSGIETIITDSSGIETIITDSSGKQSFHDAKWEKYV